MPLRFNGPSAFERGAQLREIQRFGIYEAWLWLLAMPDSGAVPPRFGSQETVSRGTETKRLKSVNRRRPALWRPGKRARKRQSGPVSATFAMNLGNFLTCPNAWWWTQSRRTSLRGKIPDNWENNWEIREFEIFGAIPHPIRSSFHGLTGKFPKRLNWEFAEVILGTQSGDQRI
jgi:hypothetical protein